MRTICKLQFPITTLFILAALIGLLVVITACRKSDTPSTTSANEGRAVTPTVVSVAASPSETSPTPKSRTGPIVPEPIQPSPTQLSGLQTYRLRIPTIGVDAPITAAGLDSDGSIRAPSGPEVVVWYQESALPGWPGNSIISGHLDWKTQTAVFWRLRELKPGDTIYVFTSNNDRYRYTVEWTEAYPEDKVPMAKVFADLQEPAVTLITCGGVFNTRTHDYSDRLVVRALGS